jgi:hypothetical protein
MDASKFNVTGSWQKASDGHVYEAVARTADKAKRVVAATRAHLPVDVAHDIDHYLGAEGVKAIEQSVNDTCKRLAEGAPG